VTILPGEQQCVYVVKDGKAELRPVKIGQREAGLVEITEGLSESDVVISAGQLKIGPGTPVAPVGGSGSGSGGNAPAAAASH